MSALSILLPAAGTLTDAGSVYAGEKKEKPERAAAAKVVEAKREKQSYGEPLNNACFPREWG